MNTTAAPLLEAHDVSVRYGRSTVLQGVNFSISAGEIVTVVGPNGSGKSTMVRALIGALPVTDGAIKHHSGLRIGYVPQRLQMERGLPMTVRRFFDLPKRVDEKSLEKVLDRIQVSSLLGQQMMDLSGGQFQRVLLARALLGNPHILVLDEATQGLDQRGSAHFYQLVESVRNEMGCAVLMVSHELHVVMSASDRVICLNGHICCQGTPEVVSSKPEYRALFGSGTQGALALYRHEHDHSHEHEHTHDHDHDHDHDAGSDQRVGH